jgi:dipeptidyl aminopeptidase/acylaminoacyl peptidase
MSALLVFPPALASAQGAKPALSDSVLAAWKRILVPQLSHDGSVLAYLLAPNEGDAEVVVRSTAVSGRETRVPVGEPPVTLGGGVPAVAVSDNGRWVAATVWPKAAEAKRLRSQRKPVLNDLVVINTQTCTTREFKKVRAFRFAGGASNWLAVHHATEESGAAARGTLLELVDLSSTAVEPIPNVGEFAFADGGAHVAWTLEGANGIGAAVQLRTLASGTLRTLDAGAVGYRRLAWADTMPHLAVLRLEPDSTRGDSAATVLGWRNVGAASMTAVRVGAATTGIGIEQVVSADRAPKWAEDGSVLYVGLRAQRPPKPKDGPASGAPSGAPPGGPAPGTGNSGAVAPAPQDEDTPSLILWHWKDPRLQSAQAVQETQDRSFSWLAAYRVAEEKLIRLADDSMRTVLVAPRDRWAVGVDITPYERLANIDGSQYRDVYAIDLLTGARTRVQQKNGPFGNGSAPAFAPDGSGFIWHHDGHWWHWNFATRQSRNLTAAVPTHFWDEEDDHNLPKPAIPAVGWSRDAQAVLLADNWDIWMVPVAPGGKAVNLTATGRSTATRHQLRIVRDARDRSIDLTKPLYFETYGERTKREGLVRVDVTKPGTRTLIVEDAKLDFRLARDADVWAYTRQTFTTFPDWYVTTGETTLASARRVTDANPQQKDWAWSPGVKLLTYRCTHGDTVQAALFLPAGYEAGKQYPTLTYIYEKLSQSLHAYAQPNRTRYANPSVYTSRGYAFLMPDITYRPDDPGRSAVACVLPALDAAIATGVVDTARVGLQGHSWGGYQTSFIATQTNRFKTAIAGAPLTDMVSMYSSVYWNTGSANQPIFIASQGRFTKGFNDNPEAYLRNSPNRYANQVSVPFLILHNERDGAVDFNQGITYFNTLRSLGKEVALLQYVGENHGLQKPANQRDYAARMQEWFDTFLRQAPAPRWITDGVPRIKMEEELRARRATDKKAVKAAME